MEILVTEKPHILLETVELLYAYVNEAAPETLTAQGEYCLPVEAVREMMEVVCGGIIMRTITNIKAIFFSKKLNLAKP